VASTAGADRVGSAEATGTLDGGELGGGARAAEAPTWAPTMPAVPVVAAVIVASQSPEVRLPVQRAAVAAPTTPRARMAPTRAEGVVSEVRFISAAYSDEREAEVTGVIFDTPATVAPVNSTPNVTCNRCG
jgi:hypothetical protein